MTAWGRAGGEAGGGIGGTPRVASSSCSGDITTATKPGTSALGTGSQRAEQLKTPQNACGAAVRELSSGAEPRACGLADDLGLGEALV